MNRKEQAQPGITSTMQLGNDTDGFWCPSAPCVLIAVEKSYFADLQFYAIVKLPSGELMVCLSASEFKSEGAKKEDMCARFYCTRVTPLTEMDRYMSSAETNFIRRAAAHYKAAITALSTFNAMEA